jgi:hypothetical protein
VASTENVLISDFSKKVLYPCAAFYILKPSLLALGIHWGAASIEGEARTREERALFDNRHLWWVRKVSQFETIALDLRGATDPAINFRLLDFSQCCKQARNSVMGSDSVIE